MKIEVTEVLKTVRGEAMVLEGKDQATVRWACVEALLGQYQDEAQLAGEEKLRRWGLAQRVQQEDKPDLSVEELSLLKRLVGKAFGPAVVGPVFTVLEGATKS